MKYNHLRYNPIQWFLGSLLAAGLMTTQAWTADELVPAASDSATSSSVVLDSMSTTDEFAKQLVERLQKEGVISVELYHVGDSIPPELRGLVRWLTASQIRVFFSNVDQNQLDQTLLEQSAKLPPELLDTLSQIEYSENPIKKRTRSEIRREIFSKVRHFFGVPKGISFLSYASKRTLKEKAAELTAAVITTSLTSTVLYHALADRQAHGVDTNVILPVVVASAFNLGFGYWQRGNSAFKGQGVDYDFENSKPVMDRKFYLLTVFIHSLIVRQMIMASAHITSKGFTMGWVDSLAAFNTTAKGMFGKAPVEMFIERGRRVHGKWWSIGWMFGWSVVYGSIQYLDTMLLPESGGILAKTTLTVLGTVGFGIELYKDRSMIYQSVSGFFKRIKGPAKSQSCASLLVPHLPFPNKE